MSKCCIDLIRSKKFYERTPTCLIAIRMIRLQTAYDYVHLCIKSRFVFPQLQSMSFVLWIQILIIIYLFINIINFSLYANNSVSMAQIVKCSGSTVPYLLPMMILNQSDSLQALTFFLIFSPYQKKPLHLKLQGSYKYPKYVHC